MEIVVAALSLALLFVVLAWWLTARRRPDAGGLRDAVAGAVDERLISFERAIRESVGSTREDVARSNVALQQSAAEMHRTMTGLSRTIGDLVIQQQGATRLAEDLKYLLQAPKLRGSFGEEVLEEMLERVLPRGVWHRQVRIDGREAVDAAVEFRGMLFPIDAKFPRDDYERYMEAPAGEEKRRAWRAYEAAIKAQVDGIACKYVRPEKGTAEFALMFIPSEGVYYETIADRNGLDEPNPLLAYAHARHVVPVGPSTLFAFLQVILVAARNVEIVANARRLQEGLKQVQYSFEKFFERYTEVGAGLERAADAYRRGEDHAKRFQDRVERVVALEFEEERAEDPVVATP